MLLRIILTLFIHSTIADQVEERFSRRSMVRLGIRVIHKISSETKVPPIVATTPTTLSRTLRSRWSPKALKISNKLTSSVDENSHPTISYGSDGGGGGTKVIASRVDMKKRSLSSENRQLNLAKVSLIEFFFVALSPISINYI